MSLRTLHRKSIVDEAVAVLRAQILHGHWAPGDKLPTEATLTARLGVSRSTVREAINRLASAGLIEIPHGGAKRVRNFLDHAGLDVLADLVVSAEGSVNLHVVRSVVEMRDAIAPDVARLAALRCADPEPLLARARDIRPGRAPTELVEPVMAWCTQLVLASDNLGYRLAFNTLANTYTESRPVLVDLIEAELGAGPAYVAISEAVAAGDSASARARTAELVALGSIPLHAAIEAAGAL